MLSILRNRVVRVIAVLLILPSLCGAAKGCASDPPPKNNTANSGNNGGSHWDAVVRATWLKGPKPRHVRFEWIFEGVVTHSDNINWGNPIGTATLGVIGDASNSWIIESATVVQITISEDGPGYIDCLAMLSNGKVVDTEHTNGFFNEPNSITCSHPKVNA